MRRHAMAGNISRAASAQVFDKGLMLFRAGYVVFGEVKPERFFKAFDQKVR